MAALADRDLFFQDSHILSARLLSGGSARILPPPRPDPMAANNKNPGGDRLISKNRRASFNYELGDAYEAGLVLIGSEARSLRENTADLTDAWVDIDSRNEAWVKGMRVPPLKHAAFGHDERRPRKLLLHREQIDKLRGLV